MRFFKAHRTPSQSAIGRQHKTPAFEHDFVLPAHQVCVDQRQAGGLATHAHGGFAVAALAGVERRSVDDGEKLGTGGFRIGRGCVEPGVFTDQQAHANALAVAADDVEHAGVMARYKVTTFVEHLVVGQFSLGVGVGHGTGVQHAGGVVQVGHRHAAFTTLATGQPGPGRMSHHDVQAFEVGRAGRHGFEGIITGVDEGWPQVQVFGGVAAQGEFGCEQQVHATGVSRFGGIDHFPGVARHVAHHKVELGHANGKSHGV